MSENAAPERKVTIEWQDPAQFGAMARGMAGIELLQAMLAGKLPPPPFAQLLGFRMDAAEPGQVTFSFEPGERHYNPLMTVHGGILATLADSACGCAVHSMLPLGQTYTTLELHINFLRPVRVESGRVTCFGKVIHLGGRTATAEARITDAAGRLCGHFGTTCLVFPMPGASDKP